MVTQKQKKLQAYALGGMGFKKGFDSPSQDKKVMAILTKIPYNKPRQFVPVLEAWHRGWYDADMAEAKEYLGLT
jgi:hypothetical protein